MELVEIFRGAQAAMDRGDYRVAAAACSHVLETFPVCLTAHRIMGEALLEQGESEAAAGHFTRTIQADPLNVVARLGLGVANEEKRQMEDAYASYLHAWEINPALEQVRDELVRLRGLLNGDERLHPTRSGLAGIYERSGQFGRAAAEWRAVLAVEPENVRARTALAEVLWRSGDDAAAAAACREALSLEPDNARALAILADVESRRGATAASEIAARYQVVDPAGEVATLLAEWRPDLALDVLRRESVPVAEFDFAAAPVERLTAPGGSVGAAAGLVSSQFAAPDLWDSLVQDLSVDGPMPADSGPLADDVQPFSWIDEGAAPGGDPFGLDALADARPAPAAVAADALAATAPFAPRPASPRTLEDELAAMTGQAAPPVAAAVTAPFAAQTVTAPMAAATAPFVPSAPATAPFAAQEPVAAPVPPPAAAPDAPSPFVTADGRVDLTVGWDDLDRQLREATPTFHDSSEVDALAAELGVAGLVPFEMGDTGFDAGAWAPFTDDDLVAAVPSAPAAPAVVPASPLPVQEPIPAPAAAAPTLDALFADLDAPVVVDELIEQLPVPQPSGYTELLRNIDSETLPEFGDEEIDPFANPDAAGAPLQFEELLAVTSMDGTAPLAPIAETEPAAPGAFGLDLELADEVLDVRAAPAHDPAPATDFEDVLAEFGDLQPFSLDDAAGGGDLGSSVDFSDINEAPFDPASLHHVVPVPAAATNGWRAPVAAAEPEPAEEPASHWDELTAEPAAEPEDVVAAVAPFVFDEAEAVTAVEEAAIDVVPIPRVAPPRQSNGLGIGAAGVAWPAFISQTSDLIDRDATGESLFARLRGAKRQGEAAGLYRVDRSLRVATAVEGGAQPQVTVVALEPPATQPAPAAQRGLSESDRIDLMTLRVRLIEDDSSAQEVATTLERAIAGGLHDALALRVLGEAYLKLGRTEKAAAQFRQAMLMRQRARS